MEKSIQQKNLDKLTQAAAAKKVNREYFSKLEAQAVTDIAAMREYTSKKTGRIQEHCNKVADGWQAQLDAARSVSVL